MHNAVQIPLRLLFLHTKHFNCKGVPYFKIKLKKSKRSKIPLRYLQSEKTDTYCQEIRTKSRAPTNVVYELI